jgi:ABC-type bacteriocin/lantibiotic exporter with double-glycine peptidase domain
MMSQLAWAWNSMIRNLKPSHLGISMTCPLLLLFLTGCVATSNSQVVRSFSKSAAVIPSVPFFPQKDQLCGPASLQSIFAFWGKNIPQEEISKAIYLPQIKGTFNFDLVTYARSVGFQTDLPPGSLEEIERQIRNNHPVIAFLNLGNAFFPLGHYIVIIGYDKELQELIFHSGMNEFETMSYRTFLKQWQSTDSWMLVISPPDHKND